MLLQLGITPAAIVPADIDETPLPRELPKAYALRMAVSKAQKIIPQASGDLVLAADTVVACGRRILPKAETIDQAKACLQLLSGRRHRVIGAIAVAKNNVIKTRLCTTVVKFKKLSEQEMRAYLDSNEWQGKAGGYAIQGRAAALIPFISGSYSNVVGLSLYDTARLLESFHE